MIRIGIVGIGFMGMTHFEAARKLKGARVTAIATRDPRKLAGDWTSIQGNFGPRGGHVDLSKVKKFADYPTLLVRSRPRSLGGRFAEITVFFAEEAVWSGFLSLTRPGRSIETAGPPDSIRRLALLRLHQVGVLFADLADFGERVVLDVRLVGVLARVVLMVRLGRIECFERFERRRD